MTAIPAISLLVCTRNRAAALPRLLASITHAAAQEGAPAIEVVIVDNGSTDATADRLAAWQAQQTFPVHLLHSAQPGLARARNAGLAAVRGAIVAMTDDDCRLHPDYFIALARCFTALGGSAIVGGRILPGDPDDLPITIKLEDHPMIATPDRFPGGFVMGANLAMTRDVLHRVGAFDERFGAGAPFRAAEDTDYLLRAQAAGIALRYEPHFVVDHHHGRRLAAEERALLAGYSVGDGALYAKFLFKDRRVLRYLMQDVGSLRLDLLRPVRAHKSIRAFYTFCLRHKLIGMATFLAATVRPGRRPTDEYGRA